MLELLLLGNLRLGVVWECQVGAGAKSYQKARNDEKIKKEGGLCS